MKKARIFLAALAVTAVVGGSLAFTAAKKSQIYVFQKSGTICPLLGQYNPYVSGTGKIEITDATSNTTGSLPAVADCRFTVTVKAE